MCLIPSTDGKTLKLLFLYTAKFLWLLSFNLKWRILGQSLISQQKETQRRFSVLHHHPPPSSSPTCSRSLLTQHPLQLRLRPMSLPQRSRPLHSPQMVAQWRAATTPWRSTPLWDARCSCRRSSQPPKTPQIKRKTLKSQMESGLGYVDWGKWERSQGLKMTHWSESSDRAAFTCSHSDI